MAMQPSPRAFTVGHSTRPLEEFIDILNSFGVNLLVDVRTIPRSHRNPQFNKDTLPGALKLAGITYRHLPGLGGLRKPRPDSTNTAWKNTSFRGFADYMQTDEFAANLQQLVEWIEQGQVVAIMCAEAVPWRCHRSLIADALTVRGFLIEDIFDQRKSQPHRLTPFASVEGERLSYPGIEPDE